MLFPDSPSHRANLCRKKRKTLGRRFLSLFISWSIWARHFKCWKLSPVSDGFLFAFFPVVCHKNLLRVSRLRVYKCFVIHRTMRCYSFVFDAAAYLIPSSIYLFFNGKALQFYCNCCETLLFNSVDATERIQVKWKKKCLGLC